MCRLTLFCGDTIQLLNVIHPCTVEGPLRPPEIVRQPHSVQALLHQPVNLTCIADGNPAPRYRWWRDGEVMEGLALPFLYIHEARPSDRAFYKCEASNSEGSEVSQEAHLSIPGLLHSSPWCTQCAMVWGLDTHFVPWSESTCQFVIGGVSAKTS